MLTGTPVYNQNTAEFEIYNKIVKQPLPRLKEFYNIDSENAQDIIDTATAKLPVARYQSFAEFKNVLNIETQYFDTIKLVHAPQSKTIDKPKPKNKIFKSLKEKVSEKTKKQHLKILLITLLVLILGGAVFFATNTNLWQQRTTAQSKLFEVADQFEKIGDYKSAFSTYEKIINQDPNNLIANQRLEELKNKSLQFQKQNVDSLFQLYFQVPQLNNIDFNDTQLRAKVVSEYSQLSKQIDSLKENKKIAGTTQPLDNARDQLSNAYQYFQVLNKYRNGNASRASNGNKKDSKSKEYSSLKDNKSSPVNSSFSNVEQSSVFPGCTDLDPNSLSNCFSTNITTYLDSKIKPQDYEKTDLAIGVHRSLFSFLIDKKGEIRKVKVRTLNNKLKRDVKNALQDLAGIKPAIKNNLPTEVTYSGSYSLTIPNKEQQNLKDENGDNADDIVSNNEGPQVALIASLLYGKWRIENQNAHYILNTNKTGSYSNNRGKKKNFSWSLVGNFLNIKMDDGIVFVWQITSQTDSQIIMDDIQNNEFDKVLKRV